VKTQLQCYLQRPLLAQQGPPGRLPAEAFAESEDSYDLAESDSSDDGDSEGGHVTGPEWEGRSTVSYEMTGKY
jgi:hypothetical protein